MGWVTTTRRNDTTAASPGVEALVKGDLSAASSRHETSSKSAATNQQLSSGINGYTPMACSPFRWAKTTHERQPRGGALLVRSDCSQPVA